ncbi:hypothetical protein ES705_11097 [subsurface metagenome]
MKPVELIEECRSGIAQISLESERERIGSGSAFLVGGGIVTNSHNLRLITFDTFVIRFENDRNNNSENEIRLSSQNCIDAIVAESPEDTKDFVYINLSEPEFNGRHIFELSDSSSLSVGEQVVFMGYPFGSPHLTAHIGYVSSLHQSNGVEIIQIDGSINSGNSGGPLIDLKTGKVAGIITRAETGLLREQFNRLLQALKDNQSILQRQQQSGARMSIGGIDPIRAIRASQVSMEQIVTQLRRSANVGIGFAFSAQYVKNEVAHLQK